MTAGDVKSGYSSSVADTGTVDIRPSSGEEYSIHNIMHSGSAEIYVVNGSNSLKFDEHSGPGGWVKHAFHVTYTQYLQVKNVNGSAIDIAYDGVQTK